MDGIKDGNGHGLGAPFTFSFTTQLGLVMPPQPSCPGRTRDGFTIDKMRLHFYTARIDDAGTNGGIQIGSVEGGSFYWAIKPEDSARSGKTEQGSLDSTVISFGPTSKPMWWDFKGMQISLVNGNAWFLGSLSVEVLKEGCDPQDSSQWTTIYFNPFVRTWISQDKPLKVSDDDAVAIFLAQVGGVEDAGSDDDVYAATPFETKANPANGLYKTPMLDYGDSDDFEALQIAYYGRTYFSLDQGNATSRLRGSFGGLTPQDIEAGFAVILLGDDGVFFKKFDSYLIKPSIWKFFCFRQRFLIFV